MKIFLCKSLLLLLALSQEFFVHVSTFQCRPQSASNSLRTSTNNARHLYSKLDRYAHHHQQQQEEEESEDRIALQSFTDRRQWLNNALLGVLTTMTTIGSSLSTTPVWAMESEIVPAIGGAAEVTDKIYFDIKGIPASATAGTGTGTDGQADSTSSSGGSGSGSSTKRIVIGLFGKEAPSSVQKLKQLVSNDGLPADCKPKEERTLQREQLEANKVYNSCMENIDKGVNYDYAQIWRVIKGERIDFGSVAGRFVARQYPEWMEDTKSSLTHDRPGLVSVRRGADSGFGFTIYPGGEKGDIQDLNDNHIIVGQVLEGMDVINDLNNIAVVNSAKVNYMALTGGPNNKSAPSRACRYGGAMYCNENKPLVKLTIYGTGIL